MRYSLLAILILTISTRSFSQTISVNDNYSQEIARIHQLLGISDSATSFSIRPLDICHDSLLNSLVASKNIFPKLKIFSVPSSVRVLPVYWLNDFNLNRPFGY